jgi:anti-anti-sigma factor
MADCVSAATMVTFSMEWKVTMLLPAREIGLEDVTVVHVNNLLRSPVAEDLQERVETLLRSGKRNILLDLAEVSDIDAAGLGELVRAYNMTVAANGVLRITNSFGRVRAALVVVDLFDLLTAGSAPVREDQLFR